MHATERLRVDHLSFFNLPAFSGVPGDGRRYERIDLYDGERLVGTLAGAVVNDAFVSGYEASFGGFDFVRERETPEVVMRAVEQAIGSVRALGVRRLEIRAKPFHYSRNEAYAHFALCRNGCTISEVNLNYFLDLDRYRTPAGYRDTLRHAAERQLRLALDSDYAWREVSSERDWEAGYATLLESRRRHGASLSLSFAYVRTLRTAMGDRVRLYVLEREGVCVAAALLYAVTRHHGMVMFWGDREDRSIRLAADRPPIAVMNLVAFRTIETAFGLGWRTIDLGPVSTNERVNFGNARFKASIDALPNFRYTFTRPL